MGVTTTSLHSLRETARALHVGIATVEAMIRAGQLATVTPAGSAYPRVTGASILAFASVVPETPAAPQRDPEFAWLYERAGV